MRPSKSREAFARGSGEIQDVPRRAAAQAHDGDRQGEQVLDAMIHLPEQQVLPLLRPSALSNVTGNFGCADDIAAGVSDWRNGQRNVDETPVIALSDGFVVLDPLAAADAC